MPTVEEESNECLIYVFTQLRSGAQAPEGPLGREKTLSLADFASHTPRAGLCSDVCVSGPRFRRRSESRSKHLGRDSKVFRAAGRLHTSTLPRLEAPLKHQTSAFF